MTNNKFNSKLIITFLLFAFCFLLFVQPVAAQEQLEFEVTESTEATEDADVKYDLAYPGILPDHPLYWLKTIRDRIWGFLIRDPLRKSQWYLLMADKGIWAAQILAEKGKFDLVISIVAKAEKYFEMAADKANQAEEMGKGDKAFFEKIIKASLKHNEVLQTILEKTPEESKSMIETVMKYPEEAKEKVLMLLKEKP